MQNNIVIYSCITGKYDYPVKLNVNNDTAHRRVLFTDNDSLTLDGWEIQSLKSPPRLKSGHDINRYHKIFPHLLFPESEYSVYLDGNISLDIDLNIFINLLNETGASLGVFNHPNKRNFLEEFEACKQCKKFDEFDLSKINKQIRIYQERGFDIKSAIGANYVIVRRHNDLELQYAMSIWWAQLFEFVKRDQLSLTYSLWQAGAKWIYLDDYEEINSDRLFRYRHKRTLINHFLNYLQKIKL